MVNFLKHLRALNAVHLYSIMPYLLIPVLATLISCGGQFPLSVSLTPSLSPTLTGTNAPTVTLTPSLTPVPTATQTITVTPTPTVTPTRTIYWTPTITLTPTFDFPDARALMQANCRYGPGKAYLYSHGLYEGDRSEVQGRNPSGIWLWIKPENLERHCWAAASVLEVSGDIQTVAVVRSELPFSAFYGPPDDVEAERNGDQVRVSWSRVDMTQDDDRGYLIEAIVCQNGQLVGVAAQTDDTSLQFTDENTCSGESSGKLYTVDKHGYSEPVDIPWP